ncbi:MAG: hypothetical protein AAF915_15820 [Cyanobacteria bacterium P01_D01_bin.50]
MKLISGIFSGNKKNGDFFLQLKEEPDEAMPKANSSSTTESNNGAKPPAKSADTVKVKAEDSKVVKVASNKVKEVDVNLAQTAKGVKAKAVPVKKQAENIVSPTETQAKEEPKETSFAPKYLIPKNDNIRRRPGANMNSFLELARQVKTPIK